jgi:hypothetical protein
MREVASASMHVHLKNRISRVMVWGDKRKIRKGKGQMGKENRKGI